MPEDLIAGHRTPWRVWHRGADRPVLALHCSLAHAGAWSALVDALHGVTVTALDQPGHGRSADWDGTRDLHDLTTAIATDMAERIGGGGPVDVFGHSFGGTVALRLAMERPDLVRSLTLVEPVIFAAAREVAGPAYTDFSALHRDITDLILSGDPLAGAQKFHGMWGTGTAFEDLPEAQQRYIVERIHLIAAQTPVLVEDAAGLMPAGRLEAISVPVLLVEGGDSPPIIDAVQTVLARRLAHASRVVVPGAGHMVPITHAAAMAPAVQAHLADC